MDKMMKVAVMTGIMEMEFQSHPIPEPKSDEVLVKLEYVGICGSDMHYYEHGRIGNFIVEPPFVLGHESGGVVAGVGADVTHLKVGDRVAMEPGKTCKTCRFCRDGKYNLCPDVIFFATPPVDGVFCEYVAHEADLCFKLPDNVSTMEGALIEPLAVGFHAAKQGNAGIGQYAVVFGAGCIGLVTLLALKAQGVAKVFVVDCLDKRLDKAMELGADGVVNFKKADVVATIKDMAGVHGIDLIVETSGSEVAAGQAVEIGNKAATVVLVGYNAVGNTSMPINLAMDKEMRFETIFRYRHIYPAAIEAVASGKVNIKGIVTHSFDFDNVKTAMDESIANKDDIVKAVVKM